MNHSCSAIDALPVVEIQSISIKNLAQRKSRYDNATVWMKLWTGTALKPLHDFTWNTHFFVVNRKCQCHAHLIVSIPKDAKENQ